VVILPVLHEEGDHVVAGALGEQRSHGGIHAPRHADDDFHQSIAYPKRKRRGARPRLSRETTPITSSCRSSCRPSARRPWARPRRLSEPCRPWRYRSSERLSSSSWWKPYAS